MGAFLGGKKLKIYPFKTRDVVLRSWYRGHSLETEILMSHFWSRQSASLLVNQEEQASSSNSVTNGALVASYTDAALSCTLCLDKSGPKINCYRFNKDLNG